MKQKVLPAFLNAPSFPVGSPTSVGQRNIDFYLHGVVAIGVVVVVVVVLVVVLVVVVVVVVVVIGATNISIVI